MERCSTHMANSSWRGVPHISPTTHREEFSAWHFYLIVHGFWIWHYLLCRVWLSKLWFLIFFYLTYKENFHMTSSYSLVSDNPPTPTFILSPCSHPCLNFLTPNLSPLYFHHVSYSQTTQCRCPPPTLWPFLASKWLFPAWTTCLSVFSFIWTYKEEKASSA